MRIAQEGSRKKAARKGRQLQPLEFAKYMIVFTTFPPAEVLERYRLRW